MALSEDQIDESVEIPSHFRDVEKHSAVWRYGIPVYFLATFGLLLASDLGSGVKADYITRTESGYVVQRETLLTVSIFTSIRELWNAGSKALAIFIVVTSICWPYVKILISVLAWVLPYGKRKHARERLIEIIDMFGKWSFVDIFVLLIIMVAFRTTIQAGSGTYRITMMKLWRGTTMVFLTSLLAC